MKRERRELTREEIAEMMRGGRRLGPGIWVDRNENVHFSIPELLTWFGWEDTPIHREVVTAVVHTAVAQKFPKSTIVEELEVTVDDKAVH